MTPLARDHRLVGFELNLEKNHIFVPTTYKKRSVEHVIYDVDDDGTPVERRISVGKLRNREVGALYYSTHYLLTLGLTELWEASNVPLEKLEHSIFGITEMRGKRGESTYNRNHTEALLKDLRHIPLQFWNTWYVNGQKEYVEEIEPFTILNHLRIRKKTVITKSSKRETSYVTWRFDDVVLRSLDTLYTHPTLRQVVQAIKKYKDTAIPFYLFADRKLRYAPPNKPLDWLLQGFWTNATGFDCPSYAQPRDLKKRARNVLGQIQHAPLSGGGVLSAEVVNNRADTEYKVVLTKVQAEQANQQRADSLLERMVAEGFFKKDAAQHVATLEYSLIEGWLSAIPQLKADGKKKPAGYIHIALKKGDAVPDRFITGSDQPKRSRPSSNSGLAPGEGERPAFSKGEEAELTAYLKTFDRDQQTTIRAMAFKNMPHHVVVLKLKEEEQGNDPLKNQIVKGEFKYQLFELLRDFKINGTYFPANLS